MGAEVKPHGLRYYQRWKVALAAISVFGVAALALAVFILVTVDTPEGTFTGVGIAILVFCMVVWCLDRIEILHRQLLNGDEARINRERELARIARQRRDVGPNGWACDVCGDYRPRDKIAWHTRTTTRGGIPWTEAIRYCADRPDCEKGAHHVTWIGS